MNPTPNFQVLQPHQVSAAKRVICTVVHEIFHSPPTPEQVDRLLAQYEDRQELDDIINFQEHYLENSGLFLVLLDNDNVVGTGAIRRRFSRFLPPCPHGRSAQPASTLSAAGQRTP